MASVAPCAKVRTNNACETSSCSGAALTAAIDNATGSTPVTSFESLARNEATTLDADTVQALAEPAGGEQRFAAYDCP